MLLDSLFILVEQQERLHKLRVTQGFPYKESIHLFTSISSEVEVLLTCGRSIGQGLPD